MLHVPTMCLFTVKEESIQDSIELAEIAIEEDDNSALEGIANEISEHEVLLHELEFIRMFSNKMDPNNAFLDIQSGSGGTEAQDWAEMILRMYLRWGEAKGFKVEPKSLFKYTTEYSEPNLEQVYKNPIG